MRGVTISKNKTWGLIIAATVFLLTLNLRPAITVVGPLIEEISAFYGLSESALGLLGAMPVLMFAIFSLAASGLAARLGTNFALLIVLIVIGLGIVIRSYGGGAGLWVGSAFAMAAIAVGNVLVPVVVRRDFKNHVSLATGIYSATMGIGASLASAVAVPLAFRLGLQNSLALWAVPAFVVAVIWAMRVRHPREEAIQVSSVGSVFRYSNAWWLTIFMGLQSATFYFLINWLPSMQISAGDSKETAGMVLFWYQIVGLTAGLFIPLLMKNSQDQRRAVFIASIPIPFAFLGFLLLPQFGIYFAIIAGVSSGCSLVVSLSLIAIRSRTPAETSKMSAMVQSIGYLIAAAAPFLGGVLLQLSGGWVAPLVMMLVINVLQVLISFRVGRS